MMMSWLAPKKSVAQPQPINAKQNGSAGVASATADVVRRWGVECEAWLAARGGGDAKKDGRHEMATCVVDRKCTLGGFAGNGVWGNGGWGWAEKRVLATAGDREAGDVKRGGVLCGV